MLSPRDVSATLPTVQMSGDMEQPRHCGVPASAADPADLQLASNFQGAQRVNRIAFSKVRGQHRLAFATPTTAAAWRA